MYECPNCAGNLKFNIARQQLYCEYCDTQVDPYSFHKEKDAGEESPGEYEATVFTCPQCGGEIVSEDTTAATFCSFCGAAAILDSRISKKRCPEYIIPFTKTKEDCKAAYGKMLKRAIFAPKKLKDENLIEKFRGIYMPYWVYSFEKKEKIAFPGKKTHRRGDYLIIDHYMLDCQVEEAYQGLAYDASSAFSDSLSGAIAPFDLKRRKDFTPSFLSGFYADTNDVEKYAYLSEAEDIVLQDASRVLAKDPVCRKYHAGQGEGAYILRNALRPSDQSAELAMLPVWFLSYRNGERISYAVVNGQTGRAAADLPVDGKKYLAGSFLLAVPLFFLLNLLLTITPGKILMIAALLAFLCFLFSNRQISHILDRESGADDKGLACVRSDFGTGNSGWQRRKHVSNLWDNGIGKMLLIMILFPVTTLIPALLAPMIVGGGAWGIFGIMAVVAVVLSMNLVVSVFSGGRRGRNLGKKVFGGGHFREKRPVLIKPFGGIVLAAVILIIDPVSDWFYYIGAFVCMGTVLWAIMDIIKQHNMLATRKLPQFNKRGGDEIA